MQTENGEKVNKRWLILGSNCFSGASFVHFLLRLDPGVSVVGISRSREPRPVFLPYRSIPHRRFQFFRFDLNHDMREIVSTIQRVDPHFIVNFAAQGMTDPSWTRPAEWIRTNCECLVTLVDRIKDLSSLERFIQVSTPEVYGHFEGAIDESVALRPATPYAAAKAAGEFGILPFYEEHAFPVVFTRSSEVYGAHQQLYRMIPHSTLRLLSGKRVPLEGAGVRRRSFIHIRDISTAIYALAGSGSNGEVYHVANEGDGIETAELVRRIGAMLGRSEEECVEFVGERIDRGFASRLKTEKLRSLGWKPVVALEEGLREVIDWVEKNRLLLSQLPDTYIHKP